MKKLKIGLAGRRSVSAGKAALLQECNTKRRGELAELAFAHKASILADHFILNHLVRYIEGGESCQFCSQ